MFPVPFVEKGHFVGLAWLEGKSVKTCEVRTAEWKHSGWSDVVVVSPSGRGSQIAPAAATVLRDRSWLLLELSELGSPVRRISIPDTNETRPLVDRLTETGATLRWPSWDPKGLSRTKTVNWQRFP